MKVLSLEEMNAVSGAYSWSSPWDIFGNIGEAVVAQRLARLPVLLREPLLVASTAVTAAGYLVLVLSARA